MQDLKALEGKSLAELREIAKALGIKNIMIKKRELIAKIAGNTPPEEAAPLFLDDSGRRRSPKKVRENAWRIGDLTSPEREVIGYLRDKRISAQELLDELRRAYDNLPEDQDEKK